MKWVRILEWALRTLESPSPIAIAVLALLVVLAVSLAIITVALT